MAAAADAASQGSRGSSPKAKRASKDSKDSGGDFDNAGTMHKVLDSPRTREACRRLGVTLAELQFRAFADFHMPGDIAEKQRLRFQHSETKRQEKLQLVLTERAKVIADEVKGKEGHSGQFLLMMESLLDKESKRLELDLKAQLRYHQAVERENSDQLTKEDEFKSKEYRREERRLNVRRQNQAKANTVKNTTDTKQKHNQELNAILDEKMQTKKDQWSGKILEDEAKLQEYRKAKAKANTEKSELWNKRMQGMLEKNAMIRMEKEMKGQSFMLGRALRFEKLQKQKDEDETVRVIRCEERQLRLQDARSKKDRIDRQHDFRSEKILEELNEGNERVETLLGLKEQLLNQRKARTGRQEACKAHRAASLQRDCGVGPGQYDAHRDRCLMETPVPAKICESRVSHEQFVEDIANVTKRNPPPGSYDPTCVSNGDKLIGKAQGIRFNKTPKTNYLDDAIRMMAENPGPGNYESQTQLSHLGTTLKREVINEKGDWENAPKRWPKWAQPAADSPGPVAYTVDKFQRAENLKRMTKSMPSLSKAMLMGP